MPALFLFPPRRAVKFEKDLIISFFCIRKLIETDNVSNKSKQYRAEVFCYAPNGKKITKINQWERRLRLFRFRA
ncbi:MAG: hypothetical protein C4531_15335 [Desulfurivibrio sp.]|nr:MAG: hypothetical protein C4531_15335 [Desulfurivibrio sp.]